MITVEQAQSQVLERIRRLDPERAPLLDALGRVLAEDVVSDIDVAPFDNSAMDGYAVHAADVAAATGERAVELRVLEHIAAGVSPRETVVPGTATRIMTGAPMPDGADAVVMVERTRVGEADGGAGGTVFVHASVAPGENVRRRAEEVRAGEAVLLTGEVVTPAAIGLAASVGHPTLSVYRRPRVAIVATGDELVDVSETPGPGQIRNSNSYSLAAAALAAGAEPHLLEVARDTAEHTRSVLSQASGYDLMVTTGGVSMGDFDVVKAVLEEIGEMDFWRVAMRPGAPQTYGTIDGTPFFGLPGNPTSCMVGFELFVRPAIRRMLGYAELFRPRVAATLTHEVKKKADRRYFLRARLTRQQDGGYTVATSGGQSSALLSALHRGNCLLSLPEGESFFPAGARAECIRLDVEEGVS